MVRTGTIMTQEALGHVLAAARHVTGDDRMVVVGDASVLAAEATVPAGLVESAVVEVAFVDDFHGRKAEAVTTSLGEGSFFFRMNRVGAHGVSLESVPLAAGWHDRAVPANFGAAVEPLCVEAHDLALARLAGGGAPGQVFVRELVDAGLVDADTLLERAVELPVVGERFRRIVEAVRNIRPIPPTATAA